MAVTFCIREATAADNEALLELERSSPLDLGEVELSMDRSPHYFASLSLQSPRADTTSALRGGFVFPDPETSAPDSSFLVESARN